MKVVLKGVYAKHKKLASGSVATYFYHRASGARVPGRPGDVAFHAKLHALNTRPVGVATVDPSFKRLVDAYRKSVGYAELKPITKKEYDRHIDQSLMPVLGQFAVEAITRSHMTKLMSNHAATPTKARAIKRTASAPWSFAVDGMEWLQQNPFHGMEGRRRRNEEGQAPLSEDDIATFRRANPPGTRARLAFEIGLGSAARILDITRVPAAAMRSGTISMKTSKTGAVIVFSVTNQMRAAFAAWEAACAAAGAPLGRWVFAGKKDQPLHKRTLSKAMEEAFAVAGFDIGTRTHALRYSSAIRLLESGRDYDEIAEHCGHSMAAMAKKYCAKRRRGARRAAVMDDFDACNADVAQSGTPEDAAATVAMVADTTADAGGAPVWAAGLVRADRIRVTAAAARRVAQMAARRAPG